MELREALYTTRAMRRVAPDPISEETQARILDAAIRAPTGGNGQQWRFLVVDDRDVRQRLAELYRQSIETLWDTVYADRRVAAEQGNDDDFLKIVRSVEWAQNNFATYPMLLFAFDRMDPSGGSIFPAVWSAMLQARSEGVGSSLTTVLNMFRPDETNKVLGVPADKGWRQACCVPMGYPLGRWGVAPRNPVHTVAYRNSWDTPLGFEVNDPLWP